MSAPDEPQDDVDAFWNLARFHAKLNPAPGYFGQTAMESVPPPTWSFDASTEDGDEQLTALLASGSASLSAPAEEYGDEVPEVGTLAIVLDADGRPRALVQTSEVTRDGDELVESFTVVYQPD